MPRRMNKRFLLKFSLALLILWFGIYELSYLLEKPYFNDKPSLDYDDSILLKYEQAQIDRSRLIDEKLDTFLMNNTKYRNLTESPLIFVGGYGRSGTTLMRAILDVHKSIYCGPETKVIPTMVGYIKKFKENKSNAESMKSSGFGQSTLNLGLRTFIYSILENRGSKAPRLCAKDPEILYHMEFLHQLFPKAKFVYMVRDGRACAYSYLVTLNETRVYSRMRSYLITWNDYNHRVYRQCKAIGSQFCLVVKYETLILHPRDTVKMVMNFLNEPFSEDLLQHEKYIGDRVQVSKIEWSTDQIMKPINMKSLTAWIDHLVPGYDDSRQRYFLPMLKAFQYAIDYNKLDYRKEVVEILSRARSNQTTLQTKL